MSMQMEAFLSINAIYLLTAIPLVVVVYLMCNFLLKVKTWYLYDLLTLIIPGTIYWILDVSRANKYLGSSGKSLGNLVEIIFVGIGCGVILLLRAVLAKNRPHKSRMLSIGALCIMIILTISIYIFTPALPE